MDFAAFLLHCSRFPCSTARSEFYSQFIYMYKPEVLWPEADLSGPPSLQSQSPMNIDAIPYSLATTRETHKRDREKSHLCNTWTIGAMSRTSAHPQVLLSLFFCGISLKIGPHFLNCPCCRLFHNFSRIFWQWNWPLGNIWWTVSGGEQGLKFIKDVLFLLTNTFL